MIFFPCPAGSIVWISIGSFRFMPALKPIIENRFPSSRLCYGEFILGLDNKMRYFKPLRIQFVPETGEPDKKTMRRMFRFISVWKIRRSGKNHGVFSRGEGGFRASPGPGCRVTLPVEPGPALKKREGPETTDPPLRDIGQRMYYRPTGRHLLTANCFLFLH